MSSACEAPALSEPGDAGGRRRPSRPPAPGAMACGPSAPDGPPDGARFPAPEELPDRADDHDRDPFPPFPAWGQPHFSAAVPFGWRRILDGNAVFYISPSGSILSAMEQLREYLQTPGTCKCGLECPLLAEQAFNFDPKVPSKPHEMQAEATRDLTKLCNHKRKLLAMVSASLSQQNTPQQESTGKDPDILANKKKKKKANPYAGVSVSQLLAQKERIQQQQQQQQCNQLQQPIYLDRIWNGDSSADPNRTASPTIPLMRPNNQLCQSQSMLLPSSIIQNNTPSQDNTNTNFAMNNEALVNKQNLSHFITVNNGMLFNMTENQQKLTQNNVMTKNDGGMILNNIQTSYPSNAQVNHVIGPNGQIIGVHTNAPRMNMLTNPNDGKRYVSNVVASGFQNKIDKPEETSFMPQMQLQTQGNPTPQMVSEPLTQAGQNLANVLIGPNPQSLTPEVVQRINQQQQMFIQQNQKQIEMAMKGIRAQFTPNNQMNFTTKQKNLQASTNTQPLPQGQLIVQNGTVMMANQQSKTPPWQFGAAKLNETQMQSNQKMKLEMQMQNNHTNTYQGQMTNQNAFSRVPPIHQHCVQSTWNEEVSKKKKAPKNSKKARQTNNENPNACPNVNINQMNQNRNGFTGHTLNLKSPSFMEDPSGYLAQQTALLNSTISRQIDVHTQPGNSMLNQDHKNFNARIGNQMNLHRPPSQCHTPDSSNQCDKQIEYNSNHCKGCMIMNNGNKRNDVQFKCENIEMPIRPNSGFMPKYPSSTCKSECSSQPGTPNSSGMEDNPVTSSTISDRSFGYNQGFSDARGPIQGGTISTSNGSPVETFHLPEPSPTPSNSSRNTDTPQSNNSGSGNCSFAIPSPAHSRDSNSTTPTPMQISFNNTQQYNTQMVFNGSQMVFNGNQNKTMMECENGSPPLIRTMQVPQQQPMTNQTINIFNNRINNFNMQPIGMVTTMASGHTVIRDTITSVLAGKAQTATTSITSGSNLQYGRSMPYGDGLNMSVSSLPSNYPMHVAGNVAQTIISKSPLEMVQSIVSSIKVSQPSSSPVAANQAAQHQQQIPNVTSHNISAPQILMSSNGQLLVAGSGQGQVMPPPPPKGQVISPLPPLAGPSLVSNSAGTVTQVLPTVNGVQQMINQPAMLVNALPAPFVIQPQVLTVEGQVVPQSSMLPQIVANGILNQGRPHSPGQSKTVVQNIQRNTMLSPDASKKKSKKKKVQPQQPVGMLQLATQHSPGSVILQQGNQPQNFQVSPNQNMQPTPVLQALTIVPGKAGTPAHILMNGQPTAGNFGSQSIITNSQPPQQINLLQPVNLLNSATSVVQNFPTFQQFIVPGLGSMVMTADGTLIQDTSGMPVQLQIQNVNGQNVLTPVQNQGILAGNTGMVIRTPGGPGKIMQTQHSPGTQFLSPNSQIVMNNGGFNGQLSPLINVSPNQSMTFSASPQQVRPANVQQDFIQCNQMGQTLMVPVSPHQLPATSTHSQGNTTFVQQNTTIVQQQTTMVSNNQPPFRAQNVNNSGNIMANAGASTLSIDPAMIIDQNNKHITCNNKTQKNQLSQQIVSHNFGDGVDIKRYVQYPQIINQYTAKTEDMPHRTSQSPNLSGQQIVCNNAQNIQSFIMNNFNERHSVSTQTLLNQQQNAENKSPPRTINYQQISGSSPPDTTTHSPLGPLEGNSSSPSLPINRNTYVHSGNHADTTTKSPEPNEGNTSAMVQCVSSSEPDSEKELLNWQSPQSDFITGDTNIQGNTAQTVNRCYNIEASNVQFNHQSVSAVASSVCQQNMLMSANYYQRNHHKRKSDDMDSEMKYGNDKMMRFSTNDNNGPFAPAFDDKSDDKDMYSDPQKNINKMDMSNMRQQNMHLIHRNETDAEEEAGTVGCDASQFELGDLVWGPAKGFPAWPGKLLARHGAGGAEALVRWFGGDRSLTLVSSASLKTLSEGLEAHHAAGTKCRKSRKLNAQLEKAIQEAMAELDKTQGNAESNLKKEKKSSQQKSPTKVATNNNTIRSKHPASAKSSVPVKIAPHPVGQGTSDVSGRLRSSQR